jgi:hypothetical protein
LVNIDFKNINYNNLLMGFRKLAPFQQAVLVGALFFVIYWLYEYLFLGMRPIAAASESVYSALIFMVVYYFTSTIIMKKSVQATAQAKGPRKGLRNK